MKSNYDGAVDILADKIIRKVDEVGEDHPDLDPHIVRLILDFFRRNQKNYEILDDDDPRAQEASFPNLVNVPVDRWR